MSNFNDEKLKQNYSKYEYMRKITYKILQHTMKISQQKFIENHSSFKTNKNTKPFYNIYFDPYIKFASLFCNKRRLYINQNILNTD